MALYPFWMRTKSHFQIYKEELLIKVLFIGDVHNHSYMFKDMDILDNGEIVGLF